MANVTPLIYDTTWNISRGATSSDTFAIPGSTLFAGLLTLNSSGLLSGYSLNVGTGNFSRAAWGTTGCIFNANANGGTITDNSTSASTTVSAAASNSFGPGTYAASNTGVTYTNAIGVYISGAPVAGTNVTITNAWSLYINAGSSFFGGSTTHSSTLNLNSTTASYVSLLNGGYLAKWASGAYVNSGSGGLTVQIGSTGSNVNLLSLINSSGSNEWFCDSSGNTTQSGSVTAGGNGLITNGAVSSSGSIMTLYNSSAGTIFFEPNGDGNTSSGVQLGAGYHRPINDNQVNSGHPSARWTTVYAVTGTINTSDAREKTSIRSLSDAELSAGRSILDAIGIFQWLDAVAKKGADNARLHTGFLAQAVASCFTAQGLDPTRYGLYCYDKWDAAPEEVNEDGTAIAPARDAGDRYGIRPDELSNFLAACLHDRLNKIEASLGIS